MRGAAQTQQPLKPSGRFRGTPMLQKERSMVERWQVTDFRSHRVLLSPDVFLNGSNPPPTDLVDPEIWDSIMNLADHACITTSNHQGSLIKQLYELDRAWVHSIGDKHDFVSEAMIDVMDEFHASIFLLLHGFYRQSIAVLRSVVELALVGAYVQLSDDPKAFRQWRSGREFRFGAAVDKMRGMPSIRAFESKLRNAMHDDLFSQRSTKSPGGWSRRLYARLCEYSHSRAGQTNVDLWRSNGPIYVHNNVQLVATLYKESFAFAILLVRLARSGTQLPLKGYEHSRASWAKLARKCHSLL